MSLPIPRPATPFPAVYPMRRRAELLEQVLRERMNRVLPLAMREAGIDMWLVICQEDDYDPVFWTLMPLDTWAPILQMLVFFDRGPEKGVERINLSMTRTGDIYERPWQGTDHTEQWPLLAKLIAARDPQRIGINIGATQWAAGGLTHNLYEQLVAALARPYVERLVSSEALITRWLSTLTPQQITLFEHVANVAHGLLAECYSRHTIVPGVTTYKDLEWAYWERCAALGLSLSFKPFFNPVRQQSEQQRYGDHDTVIRPSDLIHSDVGIRYLGLCSDHQEWAYVLQPGETDAPPALKALMAQGNRLQEIFMAAFETGLTGDELLSRILSQARAQGIPNPKVYSHCLGHFLHEPGPLIGLPWEQARNPGRGDVVLEPTYTFTMELSVSDRIADWDEQAVTLSMEEDVVFTGDTCRPLDGRQTGFYLV